jgi:hypothetical protein
VVKTTPVVARVKKAKVGFRSPTFKFIGDDDVQDIIRDAEKFPRNKAKKYEEEGIEEADDSVAVSLTDYGPVRLSLTLFIRRCSASTRATSSAWAAGS